jgi:hypothetical protein
MNNYRIEIYIKGGRCLVSYNTRGESHLNVIKAVTESYVNNEWTFTKTDDSAEACVVRISEIEAVRAVILADT